MLTIGSGSNSTILDILNIGVHESIKRYGNPVEIDYKTRGCSIHATGTELSKRIDKLRITFDVKQDATAQGVSAKIKEGGIPNQVEFKNGSCLLTLPSFEWRQLKQLMPVDDAIEEFAAETMRCKSWDVEIDVYQETNININRLVEQMKERNASDLHLRAGSPPYLRVDNDLVPLEYPPVTKADMEDFVQILGGDREVEQLRAERETSFQYHAAGVGYLRVSGYFKMDAMALAIRFIPEQPPDFESLDLPMAVRKVADSHRGLFLVCGITGSGKSTTLASLVDYINRSRHAHIITIEDPIEFVYSDKQSLISQRQVGRDTFSFANALRGALREDPDVILVGEMRDVDTIRAALSAAETGHLVFSTLHTMTAVDTVNRVISYFPQAERELIRQELAYALRGVCCQRLLKRKEGGRVPCVELLLGGKPIVRDAILDGDIEKLHGIIEGDTEMKSFDEYAVNLYDQQKVSREEAISACSDEEAFLRVTSGIKGMKGRLLG